MRIVLMLVCANFFASTYSYEHEMQVALNQRQPAGHLLAQPR